MHMLCTSHAGVDEPSSHDHIDWDANQKISEGTFDRLHAKVTAYLENRDVYVMVRRPLGHATGTRLPTPLGTRPSPSPLCFPRTSTPATTPSTACAAAS